MRLLLLLALVSNISLTLSFKTTHDLELEAKFQIKHLREGDAKTYPKGNSKVTVHYVGTFPNSGKQFDSSRDREEPFSFNVNQMEVIPCWDEVVSRMSLGEKIFFICPYDLAYGSEGIPGVIPKNSDLAFEIQVIAIEEKREDL